MKYNELQYADMERIRCARIGKDTQQRKYYIDNLRSLCILLLVPFHAIIAYNCWGEANYIYFTENLALSAVNTFMSPWYMALMFVLAGMSAKYSLAKRLPKEFVLERIRRLLVPTLFGILTIVPIMTYYADVFHNGYSGSFFSHYAVFFTKFTDLTGYDGGFTPTHLWFLLYLFVISLVSLVIISLQRRFIHIKIGKTPQYALVCLLGILPAVCKPIFDINGKSIGAFMVLFLLGYYLFSRDDVLKQIEKYRLISLVVFLAVNATNVYLFLWSDISGSFLNAVCTQLTLWFGILTAIGYGQRYLNFANKVTKWLSANSFSFYIWHFMWLVICQFYLSRYISGFALFILSIVFTFMLTFATVALIQKFNHFIGGIKHAEKS